MLGCTDLNSNTVQAIKKTKYTTGQTQLDFVREEAQNQKQTLTLKAYLMAG